MILEVTESADGRLVGSFEYATALFDRSTIERMVKHFENLLMDILSCPQKHIKNFDYLTQEERQQILIHWNDTQTRLSEGSKRFLSFLRPKPKKTPDHIALIFEDQELTYQELNQKANQLAHYLIKQGVKPESKVAIMMERSIELIIGY